MNDEQLRVFLEKINEQLEQLATFLQEVGARPETPNKDHLYTAVINERARLIELADAVCNDLKRIGYDRQPNTDVCAE